MHPAYIPRRHVLAAVLRKSHEDRFTKTCPGTNLLRGRKIRIEVLEVSDMAKPRKYNDRKTRYLAHAAGTGGRRKFYGTGLPLHLPSPYPRYCHQASYTNLKAAFFPTLSPLHCCLRTGIRKQKSSMLTNGTSIFSSGMHWFHLSIQLYTRILHLPYIIHKSKPPKLMHVFHNTMMEWSTGRSDSKRFGFNSRRNCGCSPCVLARSVLEGPKDQTRELCTTMQH